MHLTIDPDDLVPLIQRVVAETVAKLDQERTPFGSRLAFSEAEAAAMLGLEEHNLREARRKGAIQASRIVNRRVVYSRADLLAYLAANRINDEKPQGLKKATA